MAHRSQKTVAGLIAGALLIFPALAGAENLEFEVRHERLLKDRRGVLSFDGVGVTFREAAKDADKVFEARWEYQHIQELKIAPGRIVIVTYVDRPWLFGMDREFEFRGEPTANFEAVYEMLRGKLDQRFVAEVADSPVELEWAVPVKRTGFLRGSEGVLEIGRDRVVYRSDRPGESRTWRYPDIESVSSSGPFELTLTTYERSRRHYGSRKSFSFQLKERLEPARYEALWKVVVGLTH